MENRDDFQEELTVDFEITEDVLKSTVLRIIYKLVKQRIIDDFKSKRVEITESKVNNALLNWFWGVGFRDIDITRDLITLYVNRPNKFIGGRNFLVEIREELQDAGYKFDLVKAKPDFFYNAFFSECEAEIKA